MLLNVANSVNERKTAGRCQLPRAVRREQQTGQPSTVVGHYNGLVVTRVSVLRRLGC